MDTFDQMLEFIKQHENYTVDIKKVTSIKVKEDDDENGPMGEQYVVKCEIEVEDNKLTTKTYKTIQATCLVNIRQFKNFVEQYNSVIWL